jgi:sugar phosphate isomerase/epimerase
MHDRISVHAVCFPGAGLRELSGYWRELGARRVTLISNQVLEEGMTVVKQALRAGGGCQVELIVHPFLPGKHLDAGADSWPAARDSLSRVIEGASTLGARSIQLITGGHGALTWEEAAAAFREALAPCAQQAKAAGIALIVENASALYADVNITHTLRDAVTLAEIADIGVCLEFFGCWTEAGLRDSIERAIPRCHVVQVCDYVYGDRSLPSRAVPGDGAIPVKRMIDWILRAGYRGVFDLELIGPRIDQEGRLAAVRRAAHNVGEMLTSLGA